MPVAATCDRHDRLSSNLIPAVQTHHIAFGIRKNRDESVWPNRCARFDNLAACAGYAAQHTIEVVLHIQVNHRSTLASHWRITLHNGAANSGFVSIEWEQCLQRVTHFYLFHRSL